MSDTWPTLDVVSITSQPYNETPASQAEIEFHELVADFHRAKTDFYALYAVLQRIRALPDASARGALPNPAAE